jgi:hypothetical protein
VDNGDGRIGAVGIRKGAAVGVRFWSVSVDEEDDPFVGGRMVKEIGVDITELSRRANGKRPWKSNVWIGLGVTMITSLLVASRASL